MRRGHTGWLVAAALVLGAPAPAAAQGETSSTAPSVDDVRRMTAIGEARDLWDRRISEFQNSASRVDGAFTTASDAFAFAKRDSAMARRAFLMTDLVAHASIAMQLGSFIGADRALVYANEMLAMSDALLLVRDHAGFLKLQQQYRATFAERMAILAAIERALEPSLDDAAKAGP